MNFELEKAIKILERTPLVLDALLHGLGEEWTMKNEGGETWSPYDIVGHLIHGERKDWIERMEIILSNKQDKRFETFDRLAQFTESKGKTMEQLLDAFAALRKKNVTLLRKTILTGKQLDLTGIHPKFGEVTLRQLLATWVSHDLAHINQISRVMAKQYKNEIGPWLEYMNIMKER